MAAKTAPTRQGWIVVASSAVTLAMGRVFGVIELYFLAAAMVLAAIAAFLVVALRRPRVTVRRWVRPEVLTAGDVGRVDLVVRARNAAFTPSFELVEAVGADRTARLAVAPLRRGRERSAGYRVPTHARGVLTIGPLAAVRSDVLGLARSELAIAGTDELLVAPRAFELAMPELGEGTLGRHLLALSVRLGPGEFHSLREYVPGDEPRTIHWKASARSDDLKVRQYSAEGLRRCTVLLDQQVPDDYAENGQPNGPHAEAFERGVVAAASLVHSADQAGLQTRFATTAGADVRGPTVSVHTMHHLARVMPDPHEPRPIERDPGEGLGLVCVVTPSAGSETWQQLIAVRDPSLTVLGVFTESTGSRSARSGRGSGFHVDARSEASMLTSWADLLGRRSSAPRRVDPLRGGAPVAAATSQSAAS